MADGQSHALPVEIQEAPQDFSAVGIINEQAFRRSDEAMLIERLRASNKTVLSLVATPVGDRRLVGHILFSPITIEQAPPNFRGVGLAPLSVLPEFQNRGVGSRLVREGLEVCRQKGYDAAVVLGHVNFYPRFGFRRAIDQGLGNEYGATDAFMVIELKQGVLGKIGGLVKYAPEFQGV
jgi:putative acetyltransferase